MSRTPLESPGTLEISKLFWWSMPKGKPPTGNPPGNPSFIKGHKKPGPGRPKGAGNMIKLARCAAFMEKKGWAELEWLARCRGSKLQLGALQPIAAYGFGRPTESMVVEETKPEVVDMSAVDLAMLKKIAKALDFGESTD